LRIVDRSWMRLRVNLGEKGQTKAKATAGPSTPLRSAQRLSVFVKSLEWLWKKRKTVERVSRFSHNRCCCWIVSYGYRFLGGLVWR
jgi:hypothetical protein